MKLKKVLNNLLPDFVYYNLILLYVKNHSAYNEEKIKKFISKKYKKKIGQTMNWNNPKTYTEKLNYSKFYNSTKLKTKLTDKVLVRDWVKEKIGEKYLVPILGVYDKFDDIDFNKLPNTFVIKCNHDSGSVFVCKDKSKLNIKKLKKKFDFYLKVKYAYIGFEMHYKNIKPKIIIEEFLGDSINDYKFLCFDSKPYYCWVDFDRYTNHKRNIYDLDWNIQPFNQMKYGNYDKEVPVPSKLEEMISITKKLCKGFDHVRVDFYIVNDKIYFGEMTFTNGDGMECITPSEYDIFLGNLWKMRKK